MRKRAPSQAAKSQDPPCALVHKNTSEDATKAHEALRADPILWSRLSFSGIQPDLGGVLWELRDCPCCGSTVSREISAADALGAIAEQAGRIQRSLDVLRGRG